MDESHPSVSALIGCLSSDELLNICDTKGDDDLQVYRLNSDKAVAWLKAKVHNIFIKGFIGYAILYAGVSLEAGNRRKPPPTLSELTSHHRLFCLDFTKMIKKS